MSPCNTKIAPYVALSAIKTFITSRPAQNGRHFADDIFKCIEWKCLFFIEMSPKIDGSIGNKPAFLQIMAWRLTGDKTLFEPMMAWFPDAYIRHSTLMSLSVCHVCTSPVSESYNCDFNSRLCLVLKYTFVTLIRFCWIATSTSLIAISNYIIVCLKGIFHNRDIAHFSHMIISHSLPVM